MKIFEILLESRKNPEVNPKISVNQHVANRVNLANSSIAGVKNVFVSFTRLEKLGINPSSKFKGTPLGIYAYPAEYVVKKAGLTKQLKSPTLPFAGDAPFANIFSVAGNVLNLAKVSSSDVDKYLSKIQKVLITHTTLKKSQIAYDLEDIVSQSEYEIENASSAGARFWYITKLVSEQLLAPALSTSTEVAWNKLFRLLNVAGVVDTGLGIIEPREPTQAVFFSSSVITQLERVDNKYSPGYIDKQVSAHRRTENNNEIF